MIEEDIAKLITDNVSIDGRVYPHERPQDDPLPAITYQVVSDLEDTTHDGPLGYREAFIDINVWSNLYSEAKQIAKDVRTVLNGYSGSLDSTEVQYIRLDSASDSHEPENNMHRVKLDFVVTFSEL